VSDTLVSVELTQVHDYQFDVHFGDGIAPLRADEPPPMGQGMGPTPVQLLAASVGNCLSDSLLFALRKFKQAPEPIRTRVQAQVGRNPQGRLRVLGLQVDLQLGVPAAELAHLDRVLGSFQDYCTVTQSVGAAMPITVRVQDALGATLA